MSDRALKIAIVGINYFPESVGIAPYTTGLATALAQRGHDVTVLTGYPHYPRWRRTPEAAKLRSGETLCGVRVRRFNHPVPRALSWAGRAVMELVFGLQVITARWGRPDVLICVTPPMLSAALAVLRARLTPRRPAVGILVQDLYTRGIAETGAASGLVARALRAVESALMKHADGISVIHRGFIDDITDDLGVDVARVREIRNWTHIDEPESLASKVFRDQHGWDDDEIIVLHAGNIGYKQGLENVVAAAALAESTQQPVRFVLIGDGNQRRMLERHSQGIGALQFLEAVSEDQFPAALGAADVLLVNERPGVAHMSMPSKLTSYFRSGKPVVAAVEPFGYTAREIVAARAGVCVAPGRPDLLLAEVLRVGRNHDVALKLGDAGRQYSSDALREEQSIDGYEDWVTSLAEGRVT